MKKNKNLKCIFIIILILIGIVLFRSNGNIIKIETINKKYQDILDDKIYLKNIESNDIIAKEDINDNYISYALLDLDNDMVEELIIRINNGSDFEINMFYTIINKKIKYIGKLTHYGILAYNKNENAITYSIERPSLIYGQILKYDELKDNKFNNVKNLVVDIDENDNYIYYFTNSQGSDKTIISEDEYSKYIDDNKVIEFKDIGKSNIDNQEENKMFGSINGTADTIDGKTIIVSIYADDYGTKWDFNKDKERIEDTFDNLKIATNYLKEQVKKYGKNATFIYDWENNSDLKYEAQFTDDIVALNGNYDLQREWIVNNIDIDKLINKYKADNIIFMFFFNNKEFKLHSAYTYNKFDIELINMFLQEAEGDTYPATYAHEIMHTFGAPDLYMENDIINEDYINYLIDINSNDIMRTISPGKEITNTFSSLDAYYVGLINSHEDIEKWNLGISEHLTEN